MTRIKICGLKTIEDIYMVNQLKPEYAGFVFAGKKRRITPAQAGELKQALEPGILSVGVFVNELPERIAVLANGGIIDLIQLHGDEDEAYIRHLKEYTDKPLIKAVRVRSTEDILAAQELPVEYLLLDSYQEEAYGGSGRVFPWELVPALSRPFFLAGGLTAENVAEAIDRLHPWALDVSSSVETDGKKDKRKVERFMEQVRGKDDGNER